MQGTEILAGHEKNSTVYTHSVATCTPRVRVNISIVFRTHPRTRQGQHSHRCPGGHPIVGIHGEGGCRTGLHERLEKHELRALRGLVARVATAMCSFEQRIRCLLHVKAEN